VDDIKLAPIDYELAEFTDITKDPHKYDTWRFILTTFLAVIVTIVSIFSLVRDHKINDMQKQIDKQGQLITKLYSKIDSLENHIKTLDKLPLKNLGNNQKAQ
jgi:hypothetical protein